MVHFIQVIKFMSIEFFIIFLKAMVFLIVMYGCESWTIKKAEH